MGAEPPSVVPLRTLLREISVQVLKGGNTFLFYFFNGVNISSDVKPLRSFISALVHLKKCINYW